MRTTLPSTSGGSRARSARSPRPRCRLGGILERHLQPLPADPGLELVRGALGDHLAVVDHRDPVGEPVGLVQRLRREQDRDARRHARLDRLEQRHAAARVEPGGGLVEEQHRRPRHERGREVEPAAHAARVGAHEPARRPRPARSRSSSSLARSRAGRGPGGRGGRPSRGSRSPSGSRPPPRTGRRGRCGCGAPSRLRDHVEPGHPGAARVSGAAAW